MSTKHYMKPEKGGGRAVCIPANEWGNYRAKGFVFCDKAEFDAQEPEPVKDAEPVAKKKAKKKKSG